MGANIGQSIGQGVNMRGDFEMGETPIADALYEGLRRRADSALFRQALTEEFFKPEDEPEKLHHLSGPVTMVDGTALVPKPKRGSVLQEAITTINGERQDVYGSPEDSFALIARYWNTYLDSRPGYSTFMGAPADHAQPLGKEDVAMMMTLFKIAREANQHKRDNIVDAAGYLGIYADMQGEDCAE